MFQLLSFLYRAFTHLLLQKVQRCVLRLKREKHSKQNHNVCARLWFMSFPITVINPIGTVL